MQGQEKLRLGPIHSEMLADETVNKMPRPPAALIPALSQLDFPFAELPVFCQQFLVLLKLARVGFCCLRLKNSVRYDIASSLCCLDWWWMTTKVGGESERMRVSD